MNFIDRIAIATPWPVLLGGFALSVAVTVLGVYWSSELQRPATLVELAAASECAKSALMKSDPTRSISRAQLDETEKSCALSVTEQRSVLTKK